MASERFDKGRIFPQAFERPGSDIRRMGYLKKLKVRMSPYVQMTFDPYGNFVIFYCMQRVLLRASPFLSPR